jgi:hypothetical protein
MMEKSAKFCSVAKLIGLIVVLAGLTACGGVNFVRGDIDPLKGTERVGVLVAKHEVYKSGGFQYQNISDKLNEDAAAKMGDHIKGQLAKKGFSPVIIPAGGKVAAMVQRYKELPRSSRKVLSKPDAANLGDLHELFQENGIDYILLYEGESLARRGALQNLTAASVATGLGVALNSMVITGPAKGFTITYTSTLDASGKLNFYNREQFSKKGDIFSLADREEIAEAIVNGWINTRK